MVNPATRSHKANNMRFKFVLAALLCIVATPLHAANERGCVTQDLVGDWQLVNMVGPAKQQAHPSDPYYFKYQRLLFDTEGKVRHFTTSEGTSAAEVEALIASMPRQKTYTVDENGVLHVKGPERTQYFLCTYIMQTNLELNVGAGDILLSTFGRDKQITLARLWRKLK